MKFCHLSDLHLGKRMHEFSMLEDQAYILNQILEIIDREGPEAVLIAGDIYDKAVPPAEAVQLFDDFLFRLSQGGRRVFVISGNHDSPERIAFGARLIRRGGVYLSPVYDGEIIPVPLTDEHGTVDVFMLPFIKPAHVRRFFPEEDTSSYTRAVAAALRRAPRNPENRSVLLAHQFVTGGSVGGSEEISVGGLDNVDAEAFDGFDYVALGHLHSPQHVGRETLRYCGTPLKYSLAEAGRDKSVTMAELGAKGDVSVREIPLTPLRDVRRIRGLFSEITARSFYEGTNTGDYIYVTLTDEEDVPDAAVKLRKIYPNILHLDYDNRRTRADSVLTALAAVERKSPLELFGELYEAQNGQPLSPEQAAFMAALTEEVWEVAE